MNGRERLVAWAKGELSDEAMKRAVLAADRAATDNVDGDDEHAVFVAELVAGLGLKRPNKRPEKLVDYDELRAVITGAIPATGTIAYSPINAVVGKHFGMAANTASKHTMPLLLIPKIMRDNGLKTLVRSGVSVLMTSGAAPIADS